MVQLGRIQGKRCHKIPRSKRCGAFDELLWEFTLIVILEFNEHVICFPTHMN